jgi:hypothetical protein
MRAILLLMTLAACSLNVDYTGTNFACDNGVCPEGFVCVQDLCIPTEPAPPTCTASIATGNDHSCLVRDTDGSVWCWGRNHQGQLGNGTTVDSSVPVQVEGITGATTALTGGNYSCAIVAGAVSCWGANDEGQLGDNSQTGSRTPVGNGLMGITAMALGDQHACAINTDGAVFCWGSNAGGQLGDNTMSSRRVPGVVPGVTATAISASDDSTCIVESKVLVLGFNGEVCSNAPPTRSWCRRRRAVANFAGVSIGGAPVRSRRLEKYTARATRRKGSSATVPAAPTLIRRFHPRYPGQGGRVVGGRLAHLRARRGRSRVVLGR